MGLFPSAPDVTIRAPSTLFVGQPAEVEIEIVAAEPTRIEYVDVRLVGKQGWSVGSGKSRVSNELTYPDLGTRLLDAGTLAAGTTRLVTRFTVPSNAPPSHDLSPAWAHYQLRVRVAIPWWPDGRYRFELPLRRPVDAAIRRQPVAVRSTPADAPPGKPRLELSLASSHLIAGEVATGACAVFHMSDADPREVDLQLVPSLVLVGAVRDRERTAQPFGLRITLPAGSAGKSVPFELALPADMTPTFAAETHRLTWSIIAKTGSFFGPRAQVELPLVIADPSAGALTAPLAAPPRLADERSAAVFAAFAARAGWRIADPIDADDDAGPDADDEPRAGAVVATREVGDSELRIEQVYRGETGTFVVATVAHPSLGLGLGVAPGSTLRHVFFRDVEAGLAAWDRAHHVVARDVAQTAPFLRASVPAMQVAPGLGSLVRWSDDGIVFERPVVGLEVDELHAMAAGLEQVAAAIEAARAAIPPPADVSVDLAAWRELASWLRGRVTVGDLGITGTLDQLPVDIVVGRDVDGYPALVHASLGHASAASAAARRVALDLPRPARDVLGVAAAPERVVDLVTRWPDTVTDLRVSDGVIGAALRLPSPAAIDVARVRALVEDLRAIAAALDPAAGPYR